MKLSNILFFPIFAGILSFQPVHGQNQLQKLLKSQ